jgi:hypothetical protein
MTEIDELLQEFPPGVREHLRQAWDKMPEAARDPLTEAVRRLPGDLGHWRELMRLALSHVRMITGDKRRVAIVAPPTSASRRSTTPAERRRPPK